MDTPSIKDYFKLPKDIAYQIRYGLDLHKCKSCDGEGERYALIEHDCNCEYCDIVYEEDEGEFVECEYCNGTGKALDDKAYRKAIELLRKVTNGEYEME